MKLSMGIVERGLKLLSIDASAENLKIANFLIRKTAHFILYFLLGCGLCGLLNVSGRMNRRLAPMLAIFLGAAFAATDEFYQSFTERTASVKDVLLDTCGVVLGALLISFLLSKVRKCRTKDEKREIGDIYENSPGERKE